MNNPFESMLHWSPANKAGVLSTGLILVGVFHEIGGYKLREDMGYIAIALGLFFCFVWLLLLFKPPPSQDRRKGDKTPKK